MLGILAGFLITLFSISVAKGTPEAHLFVRTIVLRQFHPGVFVIAVAIGLPITTEIVFHSILMRGFLRVTTPLNSVLLSSLLFAMVWPVFGFWTGLILGTVSGIGYYRTQSLVACVCANATATIGLSMYILLLRQSY